MKQQTQNEAKQQNPKQKKQTPKTQEGPSSLELFRLKQLLRYEEKARRNGFSIVAGVDEAGRGPLAGPVVAAACVIPEGLLLEGVNDSKKLTPAQRASLYDTITSHTQIVYSIGVVDHETIDKVNIYQATIQAMIQAVDTLETKPDLLLVDGLSLPHTSIPSECIIKGDTKSQSIAAASILAKEHRDRLMFEYHTQWPEYGFDRHKGYATAAHIEAINSHGPCPIHRKTFEPVKSLFFAPKQPEELSLF